MPHSLKRIPNAPILWLGLLLSVPAIGQAQGSDDEIAEIREMLSAMKAEYEARITELERRLEQAELSGREAVPDRPRSVSGSVTAGNAFNPQISVILDGNYYHDGIGGDGTSLAGEVAQPSHPGHGHDEHAHGGGQTNGFNLRTAEFAFTATVDPYFDASAFVTVEGDDIDLEEAWFSTRALPYGLKLKAGKFLSDFGYLNNKHEHQWEFADQNLAYLNLLGDHGLQDAGAQLTWLPKSPVYTLLGIELLHGEQERVGAYVDDAEERDELGLSDRDDGPRMMTLFAKVSPDLGFDHALQIGGSYVHNDQHQEIHEEPLFETGLDGDADLFGLDIVYKYDNAAAYGHRDFNLQAEYLRSVKDVTVTAGDPLAIGNRRKLTTDGLYVQGTYGFLPRWQVGLRYDALGMTNKVTGDVAEEFGSSDRWTAAVTWIPTEFSRFRMQYSHNDLLTESGMRESFNTFWLQFLMSLGTHGAHRFLRSTPLRLILKLIFLLGLASSAVAETFDVVATSSTGGLIAREVGSGHANVTVLGPPDRDLHYLQARPSMMRALRGADLLIAVGGDLEVGWLPVALRQSANPGIHPGRRGYFEFAAQVELLDVGGVADRALGDVHPLGNPHVHMDPVRVAAVAIALAERFAELDPEHASHFAQHAAEFVESIQEKLPEWQARVAASPGAVLFHQDANYLFYRFDVPIHGYLEPVPGIPPTAAHIKSLTDSLRGKTGVVMHTTFQPERAPQALGEALDWPVVRMPLEPPLESMGSDYIEHIERWIEAMETRR